QVAEQGTSGHGKSPPTEGWSAVQWEDSEPGAQTERPGAVGPVRGCLAAQPHRPPCFIRLLCRGRCSADSRLGQSAAILPGRDGREGTAGRPPRRVLRRNLRTVPEKRGWACAAGCGKLTAASRSPFPRVISPSRGMSEITQILDAVAAGDRQAAAQLLPLVYAELRRLPAARLPSESPGPTPPPTHPLHPPHP